MKSERKSNWQYLFIKENRLKGNGFSSRLVPLSEAKGMGYNYEEK